MSALLPAPAAKRALSRAACSLAALLLGACAVGPDFERPAAPDTASYTPEPLPAETVSADTEGGNAQQFLSGRDIPAEWWRLFQSAPLDRLIAEAIEANPNLDAAEAALRSAQESASAESGALFPSLSANGSATRQKASSASFGVPGASRLYSVGTATLNVAYVLDVFGGTRRRIESAEAEAEYQRFQVEAAYITLTSNVVTTAIGEASLRAQIAATNEIIALQTDQLGVLQKQFDLGAASGAAVLAQEAALAQARVSLPPLEKQLAATRNQLAVLAGRLPSDPVPGTFELADLKLPSELPVTLPSQLVEQRPDIRAAEARLHQASAAIGIATANMLPQISISGAFGSSASPVGNLFSGNTSIWSIGASLTQPLFNGGALLHERRAAEADYDQAAALYRGTVLSAFQDVANALRALQADASALNAALAAERSANDSLKLARQQYEIGAISYTTLLDAQRTYFQARIGRVQAQSSRYADTAVLFQALGGGWWNRDGVIADAARRG